MHPLCGETHHTLDGSYMGKSLHNARIHKGDIVIGKTPKNQPNKHHPLKPKIHHKKVY